MSRTAAAMVCAIALVLGLWFALYRSIPTRQTATGDEVNWLAAGDITYRLVRNGAGPSAWNKAYRSLGSFGNLNPPLGKLVFGIALSRVKTDDKPAQYRWKWEDTVARNTRYENRVPIQHAQAAREAAALFGALNLALVIVLAYQITGMSWVSLAAAVALIWCGAFRSSATHIFTDMPQIACMLGGIVAFQRHLTSRSWLSLAAAGILMGCSVAVKYSSAPVLLCMGLFAVLSSGTALQRFGRGALLTALSIGLFIAVNPYLYPDPLGRTFDIISHWDGMMDRIANRPQHSRIRVDDWAQGLVRITRHGMLRPSLGQPFPYAGVASGLLVAALTSWILARYRVHLSAPWQSVEHRTGLALAGAGLVGFALGAVGPLAWLYLLGANALAWKLATGEPGDPRRVVCAFFVSCVFMIWLSNGLWLQLDWSRYSLRVLVLMPPVLCAGLAALAGSLRLEARAAAT